MRKPFIAGNWKMYTDLDSATALAKALAAKLKDSKAVEIGVAPPFPLIPAVKAAVAGSGILVGAQNMHPEPEGAFTGEVSAKMLRSIGADFVIIGHSERRHIFGENDEFINRKVHAALAALPKVILCVGETLEEREANRTLEVVNRQLSGGLKGVERLDNITIAYEPVWAIGTGRTATPEIAEEVHSEIRRKLAAMYSADVAEKTRIQYGGSVKPDNMAGLMAMKNIDGALVGGASLKADSFAAIVNYKKEA
jgi:triosephosphate isomerase